MSAENSFYLIPSTASDPTTTAKQLLESWKDCDYRRQFVRGRVQSAVALQIRSLREQNGMTQTEFGKRMKKAQPWISQIENPDYGKWSVATLLDCADAFDSDLEIKFRPFSRSLYELSHQDEQYFQVSSFEDELPELEQAVTSGWKATSGKWTDIARAAHLLNPAGTPIVAARMSRPEPWTDVRLYERQFGNLSSYQMASGSTTASAAVLDLQDYVEREKDKRRRGAKGNLKRAA